MVFAALGTFGVALLTVALTTGEAQHHVHHLGENGAGLQDNHPELPRSIALGDSARLSVLTSRVLRLEIGAVEDAGTITFPHRSSQPVPDYKVDLIGQSGLTLTTANVKLRLALPVSAGDLGCDRLNATLLTGVLHGDVVCPGTAAARVPTDSQHPGTVMDSWTDIVYDTAGNLNGSVDTTDCYVDADACYEVLQSRMQPGLLSRRGYAVVDDSNTSLWDNSSEWMWRRGREKHGTDLYLFLHGHDYRGALQDYVNLAGKTPLKPWRAHGVWWSREYPYNETQVHQLVADYQSHQLPLHMLVLDYQWHYGPGDVQDVKGCGQPKPGGIYGDCVGGFGGYVWNKKLFPDPTAFQQWVHSSADLELCLNIHDQCGIDSCQDNYNSSAIAAGIDPSSKQPVKCNMLNQTYATSLTQNLLEFGDHAGTDYWWEDYGIGGPNEGSYKVECSTRHIHDVGFGHCMHCFDDSVAEKPQLWSGYVHASRLERKDRRALLLGINGGLGMHRYPGVGSGDVYEAWNTLSFEIYLSFTAANVVTEWNHDLGGFMDGFKGSSQGAYDQHLGGHTWLHNPDRYNRWLQAGIFQGIFRTHQSAPGDPTPWHYPNFPTLRKAFQLRSALGPYVYSAAYDAWQTGVLPCHPLYYDFPEEEQAYLLSTLRGPDAALQHSFGKDFVVAPITKGGSSASRMCHNATDNGQGQTVAGADLSHLHTSDVNGCATACCAEKSCTAYVFDPQQGDSSGGSTCPKGKPCCWLKQGKTALRDGPDRFWSGLIGSSGNNGEAVEWPLWIPPGESGWVDWWTGQVFQGPQSVLRNYSAAEIPLLVRGGAIVPMKTANSSKVAHERAPVYLILMIAWIPSMNSTAHVYEDQGDNLGYQSGESCITNLSTSATTNRTILTIQGGAQEHDWTWMPSHRRFEARFRGAPSNATGYEWSTPASQDRAEWYWETGEHGGTRTLVGISGMVPSGATVTASFSH